MWLSGPTGQVKSISVTARNILLAAGALALALVLIGFVLNWVGLRIAVEYNPDLARSLGGVTTEAEQQRMEAVYRQELQQTVSQVQAVNQSLQSQHQNWQQHLAWLEALPIGVPVQNDFKLTSGFGLRNDPFTGALAMHEGIDFSAEVGTPVVASAAGVVVRSEWDNNFGNVIEIKHAENFLTRYAHLSKRLVDVNAEVRGEMPIGAVGSTGRSTGPHLHYEIFQNGKVLNPLKVLPNKAH